MVLSCLGYPARRAPLGAVGALLAVLALNACSDKDPAAAMTRASDEVPVVATPVVRKAVPMNMDAIGNVDPYVTVAIKSQVDGQIVRVHFKEGQDVEKGALLFELDPRPFEDQLRQAEANLARDQAQKDNALAQLQRYEKLLHKQYVSHEQYDQAQADLAVAKATIKADEAVIGHSKLQLDYTHIRSPISVRTGKILIQEGNLVKANDNPLVVINQVKPVYVTFAVPEHSLDAVREYLRKGTATVSIVRGKSTQGTPAGKLVFVDNAVNTATGTITLRAEFANPDEVLWPGEFVNVKLTLYEEQDALVVPADAVQTGPNGVYVFVVKPDKTVDVRQVKAGHSVNSQTEVLQGLSAGETVVTDGQVRLVPGTKVYFAKAL